MIAIAIVLCAYLSGYELYKTELAKARTVKELSKIIEDIIICVDYLSLDVFEICNKVFKERKYISCSEFIDISSGDFPALWRNACEKCLYNLPENILEDFSELGEIIGSCDKDSQLKKLERIKQTLNKSYDELSINTNERKKVYSTVSLCVSMLLILIVI